MLEKISLPDMEEEDDSLTTTVLTCEGDIHDPTFPNRLQCLVSKLQILISKTEKPLRVQKVEPWNSVRVTFSIPKEAAARLRQLAEQGDQALRELGILSVQTEGDQIITLTLAGQYGETQEIVLNKAPETSQGLDSAHSGSTSVSANSSFDLLGGESLPGPSNVEATRKNIVQYLSQQGSHSSMPTAVNAAASILPEDGVGSLDQLLPSTSGVSATTSSLPQPSSRQKIPSTGTARGIGFRSPNVVAPAGSDLPFLTSTCNSAGGVVIAKPGRLVTNPGKTSTNYGPFPFASMTHAMNTKHNSSGISGSAVATVGLHHQKVLHTTPGVTVTTAATAIGGVTLNFATSQYSHFTVANSAGNGGSSTSTNSQVSSSTASLASPPHAVTQALERTSSTFVAPPTLSTSPRPAVPSTQPPISTAVLSSLVSRITTAAAAIVTSSSPSIRANIALSSPLLVNLLQSDVPGNTNSVTPHQTTTKMLPPPAPDDNNQPQKKKRKPRKPRDKPGGLSSLGRVEEGVGQPPICMTSVATTSFSLQTTMPPSNTFTRTQPSHDFESLKALHHQSSLTAMHHNIPQVSCIHPQAQGQPQVDTASINAAHFSVGSPPVARPSPPASSLTLHAHHLLLHSLPYAANAQTSLAARLASSLSKDSDRSQRSPASNESDTFPSPPTTGDGKTKHLINPITGHLEPMPSDEEEEESADSLPLFPEAETEASENGQSERSLSDSKDTCLNTVFSDTDSGISKSNTDISQSSVEFLALESLKDRMDESIGCKLSKQESTPPNSPMPNVTTCSVTVTTTTVTNTSPTSTTITTSGGSICTSQGELKLRLKLDPRSMKDSKDSETKEKRNRVESLAVTNTGKVDVSFLSIPNARKNHLTELKVPPLHISLRGPNAAVVVSPRKDSSSSSGGSEHLNHTSEMRSEQKKPRLSKLFRNNAIEHLSSINHSKDGENLRKTNMSKNDSFRESRRSKSHNNSGNLNDRLREQKLLSGGSILAIADKGNIPTLQSCGEIHLVPSASNQLDLSCNKDKNLSETTKVHQHPESATNLNLTFGRNAEKDISSVPSTSKTLLRTNHFSNSSHQRSMHASFNSGDPHSSKTLESKTGSDSELHYSPASAEAVSCSKELTETKPRLQTPTMQALSVKTKDPAGLSTSRRDQSLLKSSYVNLSQGFTDEMKVENLVFKKVIQPLTEPLVYRSNLQYITTRKTDDSPVTQGDDLSASVETKNDRIELKSTHLVKSLSEVEDDKPSLYIRDETISIETHHNLVSRMEHISEAKDNNIVTCLNEDLRLLDQKASSSNFTSGERLLREMKNDSLVVDLNVEKTDNVTKTNSEMVCGVYVVAKEIARHTELESNVATSDNDATFNIKDSAYRNHIDNVANPVLDYTLLNERRPLDGQNAKILELIGKSKENSVFDNPPSDNVCLVNIKGETTSQLTKINAFESIPLKQVSQVNEVPLVSFASAVPNMVGKTVAASAVEVGFTQTHLFSVPSQEKCDQEPGVSSSSQFKPATITLRKHTDYSLSSVGQTSESSNSGVSAKPKSIVDGQKTGKVPLCKKDTLAGKIVENGNAFSEDSSIDSLDDYWGHKKEISTNTSGLTKVDKPGAPTPIDTGQIKNAEGSTNSPSNSDVQLGNQEVPVLSKDIKPNSPVSSSCTNGQATVKAESVCSSEVLPSITPNVSDPANGISLPSTSLVTAQPPVTDEKLVEIRRPADDLQKQKWKNTDVPQDIGQLMSSSESSLSSSPLCNTKTDDVKTDNVASAETSYAISEAKSSIKSTVLTQETESKSVTVNGCAQELTSTIENRHVLSITVSEGQSVFQARTVGATQDILASPSRSLLIAPPKLNIRRDAPSTALQDGMSVNMVTVTSASSPVMSSSSNPILLPVSQASSSSLNTLLACNRSVFGCGEPGKVTLIFKSASGSSQSHSLLSSASSSGSIMGPLKQTSKSVPIKLVALPSSCSTAFPGRSSNSTLFEIIGQSTPSTHATLSPSSSSTTTLSGTLPNSSSPVRLVVSKVAPMAKCAISPSTIAQAGPRTTTMVVKSVVVTGTSQSLKLLPTSTVSATSIVSCSKIPDEIVPANTVDPVESNGLVNINPQSVSTVAAEQTSAIGNIEPNLNNQSNAEKKSEKPALTPPSEILNGPLSIGESIATQLDLSSVKLKDSTLSASNEIHISNSLEIEPPSESELKVQSVSARDSGITVLSNDVSVQSSSVERKESNDLRPVINQVPEPSTESLFASEIPVCNVEREPSSHNPAIVRPRNGSHEEPTSSPKASTEDDSQTQEEEDETTANDVKEENADTSATAIEEPKVDLVFTKPVKRKCSENAVELIKACMGVEDNPKRSSVTRVKEEASLLGEKNNKIEKGAEDDKIKWMKRKQDESYKKSRSKDLGSNSECSSDDELSLSELVNKSRSKTSTPVITTTDDEKDFVRTRNSRSVLRQQPAAKESCSEDGSLISNSRSWRRKAVIAEPRGKGDALKKAIFRDNKKLKRVAEQAPKVVNDRIKKYQARSGTRGGVQAKDQRETTPPPVVSSTGIPAAFVPSQVKEEGTFELPQPAKRKTRSGGSTDQCESGLAIPTAKRRRVSKDTHR